ncbi:hypothetical protein HX052_17295 [Myroides marinus]|uniref:hypothetical protein n=1 Tax=Myroides marinus TaxID=703342 RepID=UPI002575C92D|nr:hypothetical protein [Myroides marinus]MDM1391692.1 hypothetical protein [Myroides marinus]
MMYTAITLNGDTDIYFNDQLLFRCLTIKGFFKSKFYIEDVSKKKLLELEIRDFLGFNKKYFLKRHCFEKDIDLYKFKSKLCLKVDNDIILLNKKIRPWKFEGDFIINNKKTGCFKNKLTFFESSFTFDFYSDINTNIYCILLFSILVIDEFNTQPST